MIKRPIKKKIEIILFKQQTITITRKAKQIKMPALTRSQSKKVNVPKEKKVLPSVETLQRDKIAFVQYFKKMLELSKENNKESSINKYQAARAVNRKVKNHYTRNRKHYYYNNVRIITEIYYKMIEWFDRVLVINGFVPCASIQKIINQLYNKAFNFAEEIKDKDAPENPTEEEQHIINVFLNQMEETCALLEPYVTVKPATVIKETVIQRKPIRKRPSVDYTGMDTVEPLNEYDNITNIWADTKKYTDPDYVYESDEDESDEEEMYYEKVLGYKFSEGPKAKADSFTVERVNKRHIRFVYNK